MVLTKGMRKKNVLFKRNGKLAEQGLTPSHKMLVIQFTIQYANKCYQGIRYLVEEGLLKESADAIADFLFKEGDMLDMVVVGEYLGENHEVNINVLKKLVGLHKLEDLSLVDALRYDVIY